MNDSSSPNFGPQEVCLALDSAVVCKQRSAGTDDAVPHIATQCWDHLLDSVGEVLFADLQGNVALQYCS